MVIGRHALINVHKSLRKFLRSSSAIESVALESIFLWRHNISSVGSYFPAWLEPLSLKYVLACNSASKLSCFNDPLFVFNQRELTKKPFNCCIGEGKR